MNRAQLAKAYLIALWAVCVYRAVTQSIVHDEALTYQLYLIRPWPDMFRVFSANNHFLNTLLMYLCGNLFGISEWSLRLPALTGAALYFAAVYRIARQEFGTGYTFLLAVVLLTLHPLTLDFMVAARGYGMALALWMWSLALLTGYLEQPKTRTRGQLSAAAIVLSLSVVANLVFAVPAAILAALAIWGMRRGPTPASNGMIGLYFVVPILAVGMIFLLISPVASATPDKFFAGASTIRDSLRSLSRASVAHSGPWRGTRLGDWARDAVAFFIAPIIVVSGLAFQAARRNPLVLLCSATAIASGVALWILHVAFDVLYPEDRMGLYFFPLTLLTLVGLAYSLRRMAGAAVFYTVAVAIVIVFAAQWNVRKFLVWEYDADTREIANRIAASAAGEGSNLVRVGNSWALEPSLNFYRLKNHWTWMQPATREPLVSGLDFYAIIAFERSSIVTMGLKPVYEGAVSGTVLAIQPKPR